MARRILRDAVLDEQLQRDGYVVVPFATPEQLAALRDLHHSSTSGIGEGYYASMFSPDVSYKAAVDVEIQRIFWPAVDGLLLDHEPLVGAFMIKHPGPGTWVPPHQDWIVTDEDAGGAINCWFPATPVDETVGRMSVLPGSHRYIEGLRGSPGFPTQIGHICAEILDELMIPIDVPVGSAIVYDNRLLHGTPPNLSDQTRIVAYISAIPVGAPRVHYFIDDEGTVDGYRVAEDFFTSFSIGQRPEGEHFVTIPEYTIEPLSLDDVGELLRRHLEDSPAAGPVPPPGERSDPARPGRIGRLRSALSGHR